MSLNHGYRGQVETIWFKKPEEQVKEYADATDLVVMYLHKYNIWFKKTVIYKVVGDLEGIVKFKKLMGVKES